MQLVDIPNTIYLIFYLVFIVLCGVAEYFKLVPSGTLYAVIFFIIGHGSIASMLPTARATTANTEATQQNTAVMQATAKDAKL